MTTAKEKQKEKKKQKLALQKKYGQRITIARQGRESFLQKDYVNAQKKYNEYLSILAELNDIEDIYRLSPAMFDSKREVTEMLLVSHVYWEIARINEMTPKLQKNFYKALSQFVKFTVNQPYQVLNAEMLRKYIKKNKNVTPQYPVLNDAYQQIFVQSKKCYIATHCFGATHPTTNIYRNLKDLLLEYPLGQKFIILYYETSPQFIQFITKHKLIGKWVHTPVKLTLYALAKILTKSILKP